MDLDLHSYYQFSRLISLCLDKDVRIHHRLGFTGANDDISLSHVAGCVRRWPRQACGCRVDIVH